MATLRSVDEAHTLASVINKVEYGDLGKPYREPYCRRLNVPIMGLGNAVFVRPINVIGAKRWFYYSHLEPMW